MIYLLRSPNHNKFARQNLYARPWHAPCCDNSSDGRNVLFQNCVQTLQGPLKIQFVESIKIAAPNVSLD